MKKHAPEFIAELWKEALSRQVSAKEQFADLLSTLVHHAGFSESCEILDNKSELLDFMWFVNQKAEADALALKVSQLTLLMLSGTENNEIAVLCDEIAM
jgi:hypothetical protein